MRKIVLILFLSTLIYAQQQIDIPWSTLAHSPYPMISHDPQITGRSPYSGPKSAAIKWTMDLPYGVFSGPIISEGGTLFVGTFSYLYIIGDTTNYFYSINPITGEINWTFQTGDPNMNDSGYLINNEGTIIFGSQSGWLYAIDTLGNLKWEYDTGNNIYQSVMNIDLQGNIYITNESEYLYSISQNGDLNWKVNFGGGFGAKSVSITPDGNTIYIIANNDSIYALNLSGNIIKVFSYCNNINDRAPLLIDNSGNIYLLSRYQESGGALISFSSTGIINWLYVIDQGNPWFTDSSPCMDYEGNIYYTYSVDSSNVLYSRLESVDYYGNYRWTYQFEQPNEEIYVSLKCDKDGNIYCGSSWGYYYYAISKNGKLLWKLPLEGYQVHNSGAIDSDGTLYIGGHLCSICTGEKNTLIAIKDTVTSIAEDPQIILKCKLEQNYPNPF